jgi:hypothetical protein
MMQRKLEANAVALGSWDYKRLAGVDAQDASSFDLGEIPALETVADFALAPPSRKTGTRTAALSR